MLEIMPEDVEKDDYVRLQFALKLQIQRRKTSFQTVELPSNEVLLEKLNLIKKNLLLNSNKNASKFMNSTRNSIRHHFDELEKIKIMGSMLPDELLHHAGDYEPRPFEAIILFADISGFTDLSDKYQKFDNGASKLTMVLNFYLGTMVQEILSHGGDIIKYSGDAFLAMFKVNNDISIQEATQKAIETAIVIQKNCRNYRTDVGVVLNVKLAISAGNCYFSLIGNETTSHYVLVGDPIWNVKKIEKCASAGDILVTTKAWLYIQESFYSFQYINEYQKYYKVFGFSNASGFAQRQHEAILNFHEMQQKLNLPKENTAMSNILMEHSSEPYLFNRTIDKEESYSLRRSISAVLGTKMKTFLRRFMITPLMNAIDLDDPIEMLTEMRHVVIVFANFVVWKTASLALIHTVDSIYNKLCEIVRNHEGIVNKVSLFDKDMMFLIIFGLRGFKHDVESQIGLRCASELHETFKVQEEISTVSIGVTSGMTYCGVVGHSLRREYSVISVTVNKAARLMMAYPNIVSCDRDTLLNSKMNLEHFILLPKIKLKGLHEDIFVYEFKEIIQMNEEQTPIKFTYPLLGRQEAILIYKRYLSIAIQNYNQADVNANHVSCFLIRGETQQGKSRLLEEFFYNNLKEKLNSVRVQLHANQLTKPYSTVWLFLSKVMNLSPKISTAKLETKLYEMLSDSGIEEYLGVLNPIFNVNFRIGKTLEAMNHEQLKETKKIVFKILCEIAFEDFWVVLMDDLEYSDQESFELFEYLFESNIAFFVLTLGKRRKLSFEQKRVLNNFHVYVYRLEPISIMYQKALACQCLSVSGLPLDLERFLHLKSNGNPGWIKTCLMSMVQSDKLQVKEIPLEKALEIGMIFTENQFMERQSASSRQTIGNEWSLYEQSYQDNKFDFTSQLADKIDRKFLDTNNDLVKVVLLKSDITLSEYMSDSRVDSDLMTYDSITSYEQLVCKCAAVLGVEFTRDMLFQVISNSTERMVGIAIMKMFELHIFYCYSQPSRTSHKLLEMRVNTSSDIVACFCTAPNIPESCRDLPKYASCGYIRFRSENFRNCVYDSLTDKQRLDFHKRALNYLYQMTNKCDSCGGGYFPALSFRSSIEDCFSSQYNYFGNLNQSTVEKKSLLFRFFGFKVKKESSPVLLKYAAYNFIDCECDMILYSLYSQVFAHCNGSDIFFKLIESKVELASSCVQVSNIPRAIELLNFALDSLNNYSLNDDSLFMTYLRGRAYTLHGICAASMLQASKALDFFYKACLTYEFNFPRTYNLLAAIKKRVYVRKLKKKVKETTIYLRKESKIEALITSQLARIMNCMFDIFFDSHNFELAELAALIGLYKSLKFKRHFSTLANCFGNSLKISFYMGSFENERWILQAALHLVASSISVEGVNKNGMIAVMKMYSSMLLCLASISQARDAIEIGYIIMHIAEHILKQPKQSLTFPVFVYLLISQKRNQEVFKLLKRFRTTMTQINNKTGIIWYYALSMDVVLDTCYKVVAYEECENFFLDETNSFRSSINSNASMRFCANMWLWCARKKFPETARQWMQKLVPTFCLTNFDLLNKTLTGIRVMEALNLEIVHSIDTRNVNSFFYFENEMKNIMKTMDVLVDVTKCLRARYQLHIIHFHHLKKQDNKNIKKLVKLKKFALKINDYCTYDTVLHTIQLWECKLPRHARTQWEDYGMDVNDIFYNYDRIYPFSLLIPKSGKFISK